MSLNPTGTTNNSWNYAHPEKPDFTETLVGTVVAIQEVQARKFTGNGTPGAPDFWDNGDPKLNIRVALATPEGKLVTFTFQPASKKQREGNYGTHMAMWHLTGDTDLANLVGKTIQIRTQAAGINPNTGQPMQYGFGNPRPFWPEIIQGGPYQLSTPLPSEYTVPQVLCNDGASGGQVQPQNIQTPQAPPMQGNYYAAPQPAAQPQTNPYTAQQAQPIQQLTQPMQQTAPMNTVYNQYQGQPMQSNTAVASQPQQVQTPQVVAQPVQPTMPAGMDPSIAAAMQNLGAVNVQPVSDPVDIQGTVYDDSIPF